MSPKYEVGSRVVILNDPNECGGKHSFEHGEVVRTYYTKGDYLYGIKLDTCENPKSKFGLYWFTVKNIKFENEEREESPMFKNYIKVEVSFLDNPNPNTTYLYACFDPDITAGDIVVVNTGHHGFALAKVVLIADEGEVQFNREVVCRVDFSKFNARKEAVRRAVELKRDMDKRLREAQELALYEMLAEKDPTLKTMLEEYKAIMESSK